MNIDKKTNYYIATTRGLLRLILLLLMTVAGASGAWGQATYTYIVGEDITAAPVAGATVNSVPGITMTWGTTNTTEGYVVPTWSYETGTAPSDAFTNNYVLGGTTWPKTGSKETPNGSNGVPFYGAFIKFEATQAGTLTFALHDGSSTSSVTLMTVDGSSNMTVTNHLEGGSDNSYTGSFTYSLTTISGYTYYLYIPDSPVLIGLYGFAFTPTNTIYTTSQNWNFTGSMTFSTLKMNTTPAPLYASDGTTDLFPGITFTVDADDRELWQNSNGITQANGGWTARINSSYVPRGSIVEIQIQTLGKNREPDCSVSNATAYATNEKYTKDNDKQYTLRFVSKGDGDVILNNGNNTYLRYIKISTLLLSETVATYTIGTSDLTNLPALTNHGSGTVTYSSTSEGVVNNAFQRIKGAGVAYLTATSSDGSTASCKYIVKANTATATNTGSSFTFTGNGIYSEKSAELNGMTLFFGNGSETPVVEYKEEAGGEAVKVMDANGFFFPHLNTTAPPDMGTFYRIKVEVPGTFTATGCFTGNVQLNNSDGGVSMSPTVTSNVLTANLTKGVYYLYNNDPNDDSKVLWLHSFDFTPNTFVTVGQSQYWFIPTLRNGATFTVTSGASLLSIEHGVVKIAQDFKDFDDYGYAYGSVKATYGDSSTEDFDIRVKRDKWDIETNNTIEATKNFGYTEYQPWTEVPETKGLQFQGDWSAYVGTTYEEGNHMLYMKSAAKLRIPTLPNQELNFKTTKKTGGTYNFWIYQTNLVSGDFYSNSNHSLRNDGDKHFIVGSNPYVNLTVESNNNSRCYVKLVNTYYPNNPASAFPFPTHTMTLSATPRAAQIVKGTDPAEKTVFYYSSNPSVATVDPWTGYVTTVATGNAVIHAHPLGVVGTYNGSETDISYTLTVIEKIVRSTTINMPDLCYEEGKNANYGLSRTIPDFELELSGRDGLKAINASSGVAQVLTFRSKDGGNQKGKMAISPRLLNSANKVLFTSVTLTTPTVNEGSITVNGHTTTVNASTPTTVTLTKPSITLTDNSLYHVWNGVGADATIDSEPSPSNVADLSATLNSTLTYGTTIYGCPSVWASHYADLTGYNKMVFIGTPGVEVRLLLNRVTDTGAYDEIITEIDDNRTAEIDLTSFDYAHLNAIKMSWSSPSGVIESIQLVGDGVPSVIIAYSGSNENGFQLSTVGLSYQAEGDSDPIGLLNHTKLKPGLGFERSTIYADYNATFQNKPTYSTFGSFAAPTGTLGYSSANTGIATIESTGVGTMRSNNFEDFTTITGTFAETTYFAGSDAATYIIKGTYTLPVNGTMNLTVLKGQEIEVIAFADGGSTDVSLSNTIGRLSDNSKAPLEGNLLLNSSDSYTSLNYPTTETSYYAYAKENGPVTLKNTGSYPIRLLSFNAGWRETENTINYKKYTDYKKYDDFTDEAGPFVYAGGFSLPAPTLKIVDVKTGEDVTSLYQLSPGSYVSNHSAAVVNSGTGELASTYTKASVTAITDVTISAAMQTNAWGFNPSAALTGPVRVYPYDMTWYFPTNSSTEGLQFTGNHAVSMVDSENRLNIIGNVISSVMIPVQKKQKVVVTAHAFRNDNGAGGNQTINLRNAADIYEEIASQTTYNWATVDYEYTAQEDGYLTLKNITREHYASGRTLSIQKIVVKPQEILFADGPEVSIGTTVGTGSYQNPIINPMDDEVTYSYSVDVSRLAIDASFDNSKGIFTANSSGELFKTTPLGDLVVSVTASKADLVHEQTGHYTLKVITYNFQKQELSNNYDGNPWAVTQLENPLESSASPVPGPDVIYYEYIEGNPKVDIDHTAGSTTYTVTVNGLGKVRIVAVSGVISTSFVMNSNYDPSSGKTDFVNTMPSVPYGTKTYSQFVQGWTHLVGENVVSDDDVTWTILEQTKGVSDWTITSPGGILSAPGGILSGSGTGWGVIKVQATKGGDSHTYCLTVQRPLSQSRTYTKQSTGESWSYNYYTWDFHSDRLHKYVADVDNNMTANSYISDDLANTVETTDWKWFQRKEDGTGNKTQYVHFYKPALLGDNGFVIPETIGLQIESAAFTRTTTGGGRKGFGIINVYESRTGEGGLSATPAGAMTASGDRRGLSLQEGVTLTIPKLKAGWYVEMQWARLDPISGNRLQTTNLLDLNGNLVNTELLIGRCQDNLDHGGYYTFQVAGDPLDNDDYRDVSFTVMPKGYDDLYQIRVYDGDYQETMSEMKVGQNETNIADTDINDPSSPMQYYRILYDEDSDDVPPVNFTYANNLGSAVAPSRVSVSTEGPLEVELAYGVSHAPIAYGSSEREHGYYPYPMVKLLNDYGRFYITYTMFSEDRKYVVSRKTYRLKVGLVPHQQYPYTWNFTNISGGETLRKMNNAYNSIKPDGATWYAYGYNMFELNTTATDGSYYVPGATLVSSVRNLGSDGTREELMAAGEGCDEFNGLGFEGKIAFKTAAQDGDEEAATELTSGIQSSLLHYSMDDTSYDPAASVVLAAGNGHVKFGAPTKRTDASSHGVDGYSSGYSYLMDGGNTKNVLLIPQRAFRNGDVITIKGYYLDGDGSKGGFSFYETNTSTTPLATEYLTDVTANKLHTVVHTVTAGDGIAGLSEVYLFRADKTPPGMYLTEVEVTAGGGTEPVGYGRKLKCIGGPVTITIPDLNADGKLDWIYIKSSAAPTSIVKGETNATLVEDAATGGADAEEGVFKYKVPEEGSYLVTFAENTEIERIGVTHILKPITAVGTMGWATESRDIAIDHDLTGVLTKNDVNAYSVSVKSSDLQRVTVKLDAVNNNAASNDEQHNANRAVPAKAGIVLKLDATTNLSLANSGGVPLFVPAMSTSIVSYDNMKYSLSGNHMMANLTERTLLYEQETGEIDDDGDSFDDTGRASGDYTRFILAQRFISWKKTTLTEDDGAPTETTSHSSEFETLPTPAAVFYRLHKFEDSERSDYSDTEITSKTADLLNTLGDNKAYLLLPTGTLPKALWDTSGAGGAREFVAIQGVSDMEEELGEDGGLLRHRVDNRTYDLRGRVVDDGNLKPGVYIRGGKKFIVR